jgi:glycosyltransferase involved in cell wall biosynthesis
MQGHGDADLLAATSMPARRDLIFVSAGLDLDGGGRAVAGRLLAGGCAAFAEEHGIGWEMLSLRGLDGWSGAARARSFANNQRAMALALWRRQITDPRVAFVYDLLGPARVQAWLPAPLRAPYLVTLYGIEVWRALAGARRRALRQAAVRLAISDYTREGALRVNQAVGPIEVVPLCLEERPPDGEVDAALLDRAGSGFLLIVGRMAVSERYKGHDCLLEAMPQIAARLVIAGDGDDRGRLEARTRAMGLAGRVLFTGFVSEATLGALYRRAAAFVMPSHGEGFGLVYLEAMRAAKPCLAARGGAAAEIVLDGETGWLVDPLDPQDIAAAANRLLADPARAQAMGEAGRQRGERLFSARRFHERLWPHLDRLVS